ncbi:putative phage abortive infection protein [Flavobacterium soyae]|uniref:Phage abortive infection protein n=1 Tax=Flavobacterium soyae TaxID=2903098 RepID=A0ABZ2UBR0_9FLAO
MKTFLYFIVIISIIAGIAVSIYFFYALKFEYEIKLGKNILLPETGQVGDFIGGVVGTLFSLAGFILIVISIFDQTRFVTRERFENKFFDLLKLHRENVLELGNDNNNGRKEIHDIFNQFLECKKEIMPFFKLKKIKSVYTPEYLNELENTIKVTHPEIDLIQLAKLNIPYIIVFYGIGAIGKDTIKDIFENKYKSTFYEPILDFISMKPIKNSVFYSKWETIDKMSSHTKKVTAFKIIRELRNNQKISSSHEYYITKKATENMYSNSFVKYYGGNQYKLGHYFRHLFHTFNFINNNSKLAKNEKYFYAKTLRTQLSTHEQALLFINSLSFLGLSWELLPKIKKSRYSWVNKKRMENSKLITNFNLIKNLPGKDIFGIKYKDYYPKIKFELDKE